ncbi:MAG: Gfo/Idh/MocA family oxidoreductase [Clostridia bacterium]|nr:Gfo/Idh/MocA family oxidoreductase [Clostridia bacterium]
MSKIFTVSILGCGSRGREAYGINFKLLPDKFKIVSLCDINPKQIEIAKNAFSVSDENCFLSPEEFLKEKRSDALVIATQDRDHVDMCIRALELGYDVLLEKPITPVKEDLYRLLDAQKKYGGKVVVCHVLRYAPAFVKIKELLDSGVIGKTVCIDWIEQVAYWHVAHSFVRGNWHSEQETSPMILAKCCHDLDLLQYYADAKCETVFSFGDVAFFNRENQPDGASDRCQTCKYKDECVYSAERLYVAKRDFDFDRLEPLPKDKDDARKQGWPFNVVDLSRPITSESIRKAYENSDYGKCVFACDNDVVDYQTVSMKFANGVTANLTMTGFTQFPGRKMTFHGTLGEIEMDEENDYIRVSRYGKGTEFLSVKQLMRDAVKEDFGHGGGDVMLVRDFYKALSGEELETTLERSVESHLMGLAAEKSRKTGQACKVHE